MGRIQTAKLNGRDPYAYLKDILQRLPTHRVCNINELLPYRWHPTFNYSEQELGRGAG